MKPIAATQKKINSIEIAALVSVFVICFFAVEERVAGKSIASAPKPKILLMLPWHDAEVRLIQDPPGTQYASLKIYVANVLLRSSNDRLFPESVFILDDGNLAILWGHGDGAHSLDVYARVDKKVKLVIHSEPSKMRPEFVYQTHAHLMAPTMMDKSPSNGSCTYFQQRIIWPATDWVLLKHPYGGQNREFLPSTADIYTWDDKRKKYDVRTNIPWHDRLRNF